MLQVRNARLLNFSRDSHLLLNVFSRMPRPLGNDVDVVVRDVRVGFNRKVVEGHDAPGKEQYRATEHKESIVQRKIDDPSNHCASGVASNWRTFETTFWPELMPERISCLFPGSIWPP